jgi:copper chaperone CopZ
MKKILFLLMAIGYSLSGNAQIKSAKIQASGLTCSMCSNAINKSLKAVSFIEKVESDVETSTFEVTFKENEKVDLDAVQMAVENAGFSVAQLLFTMNVGSLVMKNATETTLHGHQFYFVNVKDKILTGDVEFRVLGKSFMSSREYKKIKDKLKSDTTAPVLNITM